MAFIAPASFPVCGLTVELCWLAMPKAFIECCKKVWPAALMPLL
jgi:hypothetical protein